MTSERTYVLDACIVIAVQKTGHLPVLVDISENVKLVLVEEVQDELIKKASRIDAEQFRNALDRSKIRIERIDVNEPAGKIFAIFRSGKTNEKNRGEAASIAWAFDKSDTIFITRDNAAALHALDELRGRVMRFFQFLAELVELDALDVSVAAQIAEDVGNTDGVKAFPPYWWPEFVQSRTDNQEQA